MRGVSDRGRQAWMLGLRAEFFGVWYLRAKGYRIIARRFKCPVGEIDLIARRGDVLVFIEVKARRTVDEAAHALSAKQRRRIERASEAFRLSRPDFNRYGVRFDVLLVGRGIGFNHVQDAWRPNSI